MAPKSKAEKKAEKEAELARLAEEEAARAEKAAKELAEMEAQRAKEAAERVKEEERLQAELDARIEGETAASEMLYAERGHELVSEMARLNEDKEWQSYLACEDLPDVSNEGEVNTFLTTWQEVPIADLWNTLPGCSSSIQLLRSLLLEGANAASRGLAKQAAWQRGLSKAIFGELGHKLDGATADFLQRAEEFYDKETHSCTCMLPEPGCRFGLWVNLAKNPRMKMIELGELAISVELPKALALASIAVRVVQYEDDVVSPYASEEARSAAKLMALGGILKVDLLSLPQLPKKIKGFTLRAVNEMSNSVVHTEYPIRGADGLVPVSAPPLRISYVLDETVLLDESTGGGLQVGWWESDVHTLEDGTTEDRGSWSTEGISDVAYAPETRTLSFDTLHLTSLTLLQPTHLELPYKRWLFMPSGPSSGELSVLTQRFLLRFAISPSGVVLKSPLIPQTASLVNAAPMTAPVLLLKLKSRGINLSPKDSDAEALERVTPKQLSLEEQVSASLCPLLPRYMLTSSKWNQSRGALKCTLRLAKGAEAGYAEGMTGFDAAPDAAPAASAADPFDAAAEAEWMTMQCLSRRVLLIAATDGHMCCDERPAQEGALAHSTPLECMKPEDPEVVDVLRSSSVLYQDTARQLLNSLRLFSFTKP